MIKIIAVLCRLSAPTDCHDQTVTTSDFETISLQSCMLGMPALAGWMKSFPQYRLSKWRCVVGEQGEKT